MAATTDGTLKDAPAGRGVMRAASERRAAKVNRDFMSAHAMALHAIFKRIHLHENTAQSAAFSSSVKFA
jgi:hypothetical protein